MKQLLLILTLLFTISAQAQYKIIEKDVPVTNKYMVNKAGLASEKAGNLRLASFLFQGAAIGLYTLNAFQDEINRPLVAFATLSGFAGLGCTIGSAVHLKRSGAYLQAYANGIIIEF